MTLTGANYRIVVNVIYAAGIDLVETCRTEEECRRHGERYLRRFFSDDDFVFVCKGREMH